MRPPTMSSLLRTLPTLRLCSGVLAREITAPANGIGARPLQNPFLRAQHTDSLYQIINPVGPADYYGLTTFANLPYVKCLSDQHVTEKYDIAFMGAPFDTGTTGRPGARFGPKGIRTGSQRISPDFGYDPFTLKNPFKQWAKIVDCGDPPLVTLDNTVALEQLDAAHKLVSGRSSNSSEYPIPRIITLGGDHTTTLCALRSTYNHFGKVSVIHFDAHLDTWKPEVLGPTTDYARVNHGTFLHIAHEEGLVHGNSSIHAGIRAPLFKPDEDLDNDRTCGFDIINARSIDLIGAKGIIDRLKERVGNTKVYISVDIDVLDPAFAPATGTSEPGGWSSRELLTILYGLSGLEIVGADVVEVAPAYDTAGETTQIAAAEVAKTLMSLMVDKPVKGVH